MTTGQSDHVRRVADREYVEPALQGRKEVRIRVGDIERALLLEGFPPRHINQICSALESDKFWKGRMELRVPKGMPRRVDTVYEFSLKNGDRRLPIEEVGDPLLNLRGVLKGAIREGADAFVRKIRRDKASGSAGGRQ